MQIFPAIDLKEGKAVRLSKGLMQSAKIYSDNPQDLAKQFQDMGAKWLHVVDLDGAFAGETINFKTIESIVQATNLNVQVGGGIRDEERIKKYLDLGVSRVILGSIALKDPDFVRKMAKFYPVVVGIDAKDGYVAIEGWADVSSVKATDLAKEFANAGVKAIICTDINKDGMLSGVNVDFTLKIAHASGIETIASGGVSSMDDILELKKTSLIGGVIVGKAFYEGKIDLKEAFLKVL
ncbi:1-(5-phosphoribosyl)-5-[(5-phosphoribosylamino)methylideneamino]imidazole-4-carboxamide isomerase [Campylobacter sp. RM9344]|uniref:1-(5-phosphoribosyl)-5-[(5-phosphoribosylamino)methylideneamino] imidazole-4-carboxamide isomerase n=1 Tax=Campylobacter californiensis TaxID=1032243 RepID=A0AAW3ZWS0_9BACT|nr:MULTISPECIES: 1-(5-phosphoribosyl)-5-[(5-phosphoribosylamino)methylideneamino]imidazole-4-carboxamide isomerase [unclassified Campylobacter]MBE2986871.1 1-(5-phosphoribosyl)-5-[(5-phosphoribosylamino)methylideneamino]imidazole-4-carboxamide isomerase [Campylobacter sp. RM12919]MBE2988570.1 1-(5-phosphoribosyl)-5-[(5-phosphoribosylamino)methylideneamino]imidazole-4-carboxamide isomerase [Campylobacter sp. RM12920]MBE3029731.1 1-(5-phosphoribosyl)-5-[(5-phosphoribosylamino)methylideneamino]imid